MTTNYKVFLIPFEKLPENPGYTVLFSTWTQQRPQIDPTLTPPPPFPMVLGIIADGEVPSGATQLYSGDKDPLPPPPPPPPSLTLKSFGDAFNTLLGDRDEDE
jgi:hypothetical protein